MGDGYNAGGNPAITSSQEFWIQAARELELRALGVTEDFWRGEQRTPEQIETMRARMLKEHPGLIISSVGLSGVEIDRHLAMQPAAYDGNKEPGHDTHGHWRLINEDRG